MGEPRPPPGARHCARAKHSIPYILIEFQVNDHVQTPKCKRITRDASKHVPSAPYAESVTDRAGFYTWGGKGWGLRVAGERTGVGSRAYDVHMNTGLLEKGPSLWPVGGRYESVQKLFLIQNAVSRVCQVHVFNLVSFSV